MAIRLPHSSAHPLSNIFHCLSLAGGNSADTHLHRAHTKGAVTADGQLRRHPRRGSRGHSRGAAHRIAAPAHDAAANTRVGQERLAACVRRVVHADARPPALPRAQRPRRAVARHPRPALRPRPAPPARRRRHPAQLPRRRPPRPRRHRSRQARRRPQAPRPQRWHDRGHHTGYRPVLLPQRTRHARRAQRRVRRVRADGAPELARRVLAIPAVPRNRRSFGRRPSPSRASRSEGHHGARRRRGAGHWGYCTSRCGMPCGSPSPWSDTLRRTCGTCFRNRLVIAKFCIARFFLCGGSMDG